MGKIAIKTVADCEAVIASPPATDEEWQDLLVAHGLWNMSLEDLQARLADKVSRKAITDEDLQEYELFDGGAAKLRLSKKYKEEPEETRQAEIDAAFQMEYDSVKRKSLVYQIEIAAAQKAIELKTV